MIKVDINKYFSLFIFIFESKNIILKLIFSGKLKLGF